MGFYINPPQGTKEEWLHKFGVPHSSVKWPPSTIEWPPPPGQVIVCLVKNPEFTAAAIIYDKGEYEEFQPTVRDQRLRKWYLVPQQHVIQVCPKVEERLTH